MKQDKLIIEPGGGHEPPFWKELWRYRYLLLLLVRRNIVIQYRQTLLGPLWLVIQPLITAIAFTIVFSRIARIPTDGIPPLLFYFCSIMAWNYFSRCLNTTAMALVQNKFLLEKVYFPRLLIPLSDICANLFSWSLQAATFMLVLAGYLLLYGNNLPLPRGLSLIVLPLLLLHSAAIGLGAGLWLAILSARYRDIMHAMGFITQLWMLATPVIYPASTLPEIWRPLAALNPMTVIMEAWRLMLFGQGNVHGYELLISVCMTLFLITIGIPLFHRATRTCADVL